MHQNTGKIDRTFVGIRVIWLNSALYRIKQTHAIHRSEANQTKVRWEIGDIFG